MRRISFLLILFAATPVSAQTYRIAPELGRLHSGPFVEVGAGSGSISTECSGCATGSTSAIALRAGLGWQLRPGFRLGLEAAGTVRDDAGARERLTNLQVVGQFSVIPEVQLRLGLGRGSFRSTSEFEGEKIITTGAAFGWTIGAGWELPASRDLVFTPTVTYRSSSSMSLERNGGMVAEDYSYHVLEVGAGVRWHLRSLFWPSPRDKAPI